MNCYAETESGMPVGSPYMTEEDQEAAVAAGYMIEGDQDAAAVASHAGTKDRYPVPIDPRHPSRPDHYY